MEYAIDQDVIFHAEDMLRGRKSDAEYAELFAKRLTGRIVGEAGENFIVRLDIPLSDGTKAVVVPPAAAQPVACHWCRDEKRVWKTGFTLEQYEAGAAPQMDCPCCVPCR